MKTIRAIGLLVLCAALPTGLRAGQHAAGMNNEKTWEGTLTAVDTADHTVTAKHWFFTETFHIGKNCTFADVEKKEVALGDLLPGEKVKIRYQNAEGVRVADHIMERALRYNGTVQAVDPKTSTMTMAEEPLYKPFRAPDTFRCASDCKVILVNGDKGTLADLRPGDRVTVIYEAPGGSLIAYRVRDRSLNFVGTLDAIDQPARSVQAKKMGSEKTFDLADSCRIIVGKETKGHLKDLARGQPYRFTYRDVNGIYVVDQITPAHEANPAETASAR